MSYAHQSTGQIFNFSFVITLSSFLAGGWVGVLASS